MKFNLTILLIVTLFFVGCGGGQLAKVASSKPVPIPSNPTPPPAPPPPTPPPPVNPPPPPTPEPPPPTPPPTPPPPPSPPPVPTNWEVDDLPPITGGAAAQANALNNLGHVVGYSMVGGVSHATLWVNGVATDLGVNTVANGINDSDQIVGYRNDTDGFPHAHLWPDDIDLPTLNRGGEDFDSSIATGINAGGEVVGTAFFLEDINDETGFSWTKAAGIQIVPFCYEAAAVNDSGQIVGLNGSVAAGFCGSNGTSFGHLGIAFAINNSGTAVGYDFDGTAWRFPNFNLGPTLATGINDNGWIVGDKITPPGGVMSPSTAGRPNIVGPSQAWFWSDQAGLVNLNISIAQAINQSGQIAGSRTLPDGSTHGALLTPE